MRDRGPWWIDAVASAFMIIFLGLIAVYLGGCSGMGIKLESYRIDSRQESTVTIDQNPSWFHCIVNNCLTGGSNGKS